VEFACIVRIIAPAVVLPHEAEVLGLRERHDSLNGRERDVMAQVVAGLLNKRLEAVLGIGETTVKSHRGRVTCTMAADSVAEVVRMAMSPASR
jgi:FixJ family two-component response regulator